jgi:hypothetical protein
VPQLLSLDRANQHKVAWIVMVEIDQGAVMTIGQDKI